MGQKIVSPITESILHHWLLLSSGPGTHPHIPTHEQRQFQETRFKKGNMDKKLVRHYKTSKDKKVWKQGLSIIRYLLSEQTRIVNEKNLLSLF